MVSIGAPQNKATKTRNQIVEGTEKVAGLKFETLENHGCTSQI